MGKAAEASNLGSRGTSCHGSSAAINLSPWWCNVVRLVPLSYIRCHSIFISVSFAPAFSRTRINISTFLSFLVLNSNFLGAPTGPQQRTLMRSQTNKTDLSGMEWSRTKAEKVANKLPISCSTLCTLRPLWENVKQIQTGAKHVLDQTQNTKSH